MAMLAAAAANITAAFSIKLNPVGAEVIATAVPAVLCCTLLADLYPAEEPSHSGASMARAVQLLVGK